MVSKKHKRRRSAPAVEARFRASRSYWMLW